MAKVTDLRLGDTIQFNQDSMTFPSMMVVKITPEEVTANRLFFTGTPDQVTTREGCHEIRPLIGIEPLTFLIDFCSIDFVIKSRGCIKLTEPKGN